MNRRVGEQREFFTFATWDGVGASSPDLQWWHFGQTVSGGRNGCEQMPAVSRQEEAVPGWGMLLSEGGAESSVRL